MKITVSGPPGSGTTTLAKALCGHFDLEHISSGDIFRSLAEERDISLAGFAEIAEKNHSIDKEIDDRQRKIAEKKDKILLEGRLSGWIVKNADLRIYLDAPLDIRAERIADREDKKISKAHEEIKEREASESKRYKKIYDIDISDLSPYDLVIDTGVWDSDGVIQIAKTAIESL